VEALTERIVFFLLLALQTCSAVFYLYDILSSMLGLKAAPIPWNLYELIQIGAALGLVLGGAVTATLFLRSLKARQRAEDRLRLASGAFMTTLAERFEEWALTPAERDVALFAIKGLSTHEIAALRATSEGTVKAQTAAIYRKAGVSGRAQLLSLFIDALFDERVMPQACPDPEDRRHKA